MKTKTTAIGSTICAKVACGKPAGLCDHGDHFIVFTSSVELDERASYTVKCACGEELVGVGHTVTEATIVAAGKAVIHGWTTGNWPGLSEFICSPVFDSFLGEQYDTE